MPSLQPQPLKSLHHDLPAYITFVNRTNIFIDVVWVDYRGQFVRYYKKLPPGERLPLNTFVTHPWIAWASDTQNRINVDKSYVFYPQPWQGEQRRTIIYLDLPLLSLLDICIQKVRSLVKPEHIEELEIPRELFWKLKERKEVRVEDSPHITELRQH
ncbi:von Hippel-Lindau tumor suppressor [Biomphalaria glabrata]|uniref:Protein Vhl-like n=1 Tax=Biomphalaria glabrata TaxID=6526 RepID=A0A9W3BP87_BIOGL|nr:protein Vhl-like [Biomphalaria glabrata]XP_055901263.1 protein Vhl-like [Biomphalaria glabrata]XP_055901264.1 protein Vhl-like [Biomphalaria glabrata]KAI8761062.1 von Hippel-Lindau disease tumor suppressor [Biomphalaria glabrata]